MFKVFLIHLGGLMADKLTILDLPLEYNDFCAIKYDLVNKNRITN